MLGVRKRKDPVPKATEPASLALGSLVFRPMTNGKCPGIKGVCHV